MNLIDGGSADVYTLTQACRISHLYHCGCKQGAVAAVLLVKLLWQNLLIAKVLGVIAGHIPGAASYTYTM